MDPIRSIDFGDRGCTDGVSSEFRSQIGTIEPGQVIEVVVRDPSARSDLPAMCRMLGHDIVSREESDGALRLRVMRGR
ncbi:MAG TPA: sulfurtransferase TusA family protein [Actinomycetota bacterium]|nr:sulfurtransferase TusA family protein [Actinomycetota bacterium]